MAYNVYMRGAGHLSLTDLALTSPFLTRILNGQKASIDTEYCLATINQIVLEFFDCYLKGEGRICATDGLLRTEVMASCHREIPVDHWPAIDPPGGM